MARITDASVAEVIQTLDKTFWPQLAMGSQQTYQMKFISNKLPVDLTGVTLKGNINEIDTAVGVEPVAGYDRTANGESWELTTDNGLLSLGEATDGIVSVTIPAELGATTATHDGRSGAPVSTPEPGLFKYYEFGIQLSMPDGGANRQIFQIVGIISLTYSVVK